MKAEWQDHTLAETNDTVVVEGNHYFPIESLKMDHFSESEHTSYCPWKGTARYFHVDVDGQRNENAAWYYPAPFEAAHEIKDRVAFWKGITVSTA